MHPQVQIVGEKAEQLLALGECILQPAPVDALRVHREAALRGRNVDRLAAENVVELAGQAVKGMSFGHG
ncbi:hypothetical protein GCM10010038_03700 [Glutamicibacter protophormiae]|nr:hypothetical protein GCM10010038_03700 [Glutamicibacter protophormiae]